jgi:hypothetical protein
VPQDLTEACKWYNRAAERGVSDAQLNLGVAYALGRGLPQNLTKAYKWLNLATASYVTESQRSQAARARDLVASRMTSTEVAEAERQSRDWTSAH